MPEPELRARHKLKARHLISITFLLLKKPVLYRKKYSLIVNYCIIQPLRALTVLWYLGIAILNNKTIQNNFEKIITTDSKITFCERSVNRIKFEPFQQSNRHVSGVRTLIL